MRAFVRTSTDAHRIEPRHEGPDRFADQAHVPLVIRDEEPSSCAGASGLCANEGTANNIKTMTHEHWQTTTRCAEHWRAAIAPIEIKPIKTNSGHEKDLIECAGQVLVALGEASDDRLSYRLVPNSAVESVLKTGRASR